VELFSTVNIEYRFKESMPVKITGRLPSQKSGLFVSPKKS
jgi:hypothetical protein